MKTLVILASCIVLAGCSTVEKDHLYYETSKAISKDQTITATACWAAVTEIAKSADNTVKMGAVALAERCKIDPVRVEPIKKSWFGF